MNTANPKTAHCPNCGKPVSWVDAQIFKPFCCERCKLIDLGEWLMEEKKIPGEQEIPDNHLELHADH